jgi:hypothetical protein
MPSIRHPPLNEFHQTQPILSLACPTIFPRGLADLLLPDSVVFHIRITWNMPWSGVIALHAITHSTTSFSTLSCDNRHSAQPVLHQQTAPYHVDQRSKAGSRRSRSSRSQGNPESDISVCWCYQRNASLLVQEPA